MDHQPRLSLQMLVIAFYCSFHSTALLGEYLLTDHYLPRSSLCFHLWHSSFRVGFVLAGAILKDHLVRDEESTLIIRERRKYAYYGFASIRWRIIAFWFPLASAITTTSI